MTFVKMKVSKINLVQLKYFNIIVYLKKEKEKEIKEKKNKLQQDPFQLCHYKLN